MPNAPTTDTRTTRRPALAEAVARELSRPLSACRVAVGGLIDRRGDDPELCDRLEQLLDELARVEQGVEGLVDLAAPPSPRTEACSVREIARRAWDALPAARRARVWLAQENGTDTCAVDAQRFERALATLLHEATEDPDAEVLLHAHADEQSASFVVLGDTDLGALDLDGVIARRNLEHLGAEVIERHACDQPSCVLVRLPLGGAA